MYRGFWQSKLVMAVLSAATVALAAWVWLRDAERPVYLSVLACVLLAVIGFVTAGRIAELMAKSLNSRLLEHLHLALDPEAFLKGYAHVPEKIPAGTRENMLARFYLCDGYASAGEYEKANEALGDIPEKLQNDSAICGVYYGNLARNYLGLGELAKAGEALDSLSAAIDGAEGKRRANLEETLMVYRAKLAVMNGELPSEAPLTEAMKETQYPLRKLEIMQVLAMIAQVKGEPKRAAKYCSRMQRDGGKTVFAVWASKQNAGKAAAEK